MARQTPLLLNPTIDEIRAEGKRIDLPVREAERFFYYYEANGWRVGKNPMKSWRSALMGWKLRWLDRRGDESEQPIKSVGLSFTEKGIYQKELERVLDKMRSIRASYSENQDWTTADRETYRRLVRRRDELKKLLGVEF